MTESVSRNSPGPNRYPDAAEPESGTRGAALTGAEAIGLNAGYSLNTIAVEATLTHSGNSVTFGLAAGPSAEASVGTRDADGDGNEELCVRVATGIVLGGACVEAERLLEVSRRLYAELSTTPADWMGN